MKLSTNNDHKLFFNKLTKETLLEKLNKVSDQKLKEYGVTREEIKKAISTGVYRGKHLLIAAIIAMTINEAAVPGYAYNNIPEPDSISQKGEMPSLNYHLDQEYLNEEDFDDKVIDVIEDAVGKKFKNITYGDLKEITNLYIEERYGLTNIDFIELMPNLKSLYVFSQTINDISALKNSKIESIKFNYSPISSHDLQYLPSTLKKLELNYCFYVTNLANITDFCRGLEEITINCAPSLTMPEYLATMPNIKKIHLNELANITDKLRDLYNKKGIEHNITDEMIAQNDELDKIISEIITDDMDEQDKVSAVVAYVMDNLKYRMTKIFESNENPLTSALAGKGVCASYAYFTSVLLTKAGIECYEVTDNKHGWNIVNIDGKYYYADPTNINRIPILSQALIEAVEHLDIGLFYMQDPFSTFLSAMKDADHKKVNMSDELLLEILATEETKSFSEKYLSNLYVDMLVALGILVALSGIGRIISERRR